MSLGRTVRHRLGPLEGRAAETYRSLFFDLDAFARTVASLARPDRVLEAGCGEGMVTARLVRVLPDALFDAVDPCPDPGRLFRGDRGRVRFHRGDVPEWTAAHPASVDLVVLCDVLHHVPWSEHPRLLQGCARALRPGGLIVVKEWTRGRSPAWRLGHLSDRWISESRVRCGTAAEWRAILLGALGPGASLSQVRVPRWDCNEVFAVRPGGT